MQMTPAVLAALKADFANAAAAWKVMSSFEATHSNTLPGPALTDAFGAPLGQTLAIVEERHVSVVIESVVREQVLIFQLEGPAGGAATKATLNCNGNAIETTDAALIAALESKLPAVSTLVKNALHAVLTAPLLTTT